VNPEIKANLISQNKNTIIKRKRKDKEGGGGDRVNNTEVLTRTNVGRTKEAVGKFVVTAKGFCKE